jgi:hypothetical protein
MQPPIHRWLTDLEHTACGHRRPRVRRRPLVVRGWPDVTCKRCLGSIHFKLEQWQRQQPGSPGEPQGHPRRGGADPHTRAADTLTAPLLRIPSARTHR